MSQEVSNIDSEKHENVKEKLNTLLHKKIHDQNEKLNENTNKTEEKIGEVRNELPIELTEDEETNNSDEESILSQHVLHYILNEKKKELLRNKEVVRFLQNKLKYN